MNWIVQSRQRPGAGAHRPLPPRTALYARPRPQVAGQAPGRPESGHSGAQIPTRLGSWTSGSPLHDRDRLRGRSARCAGRMLPVVPDHPAGLVARYPEALPAILRPGRAGSTGSIPCPASTAAARRCASPAASCWRWTTACTASIRPPASSASLSMPSRTSPATATTTAAATAAGGCGSAPWTSASAAPPAASTGSAPTARCCACSTASRCRTRPRSRRTTARSISPTRRGT